MFIKSCSIYSGGRNNAVVYSIASLLSLATISIAFAVPTQHQQTIAYGFENATTCISVQSDSQPFYAIAHRVLMREGIDAAVKHGANALEMDYTAWWTGADSPGWWADHDGTASSWGDKAEVMFKHIAEKRLEGANILFVWLDIKNPNACDPGDSKWYKCSVQYLQDLAREWLLPAGVRVLYGTHNDGEVEKGAYSKLAIRGLKPAEAIDIDGNFDNVNALFDKYGGRHSTPIKQRVMSKGLFNWSLNIGNILAELQRASSSGKFGRTFSWTMINRDSNIDNIRKLIANSHSDGLIYGGILHYQDGELSKAPLALIKKVVEETPGVHMAQVSRNDWPW
jgi:sphingomyelin phosphodiesterase D